MNQWHGCYDDGWQGLIVPEAFAHPAKMAYGLTMRIFKHALSEAWIKPGDVVVDPFGGIGSTGLVGSALGLRVVCVELEQKFVDLGKANFEKHSAAIDAFHHFGHSYQPVIIQGDSRKLSEVIAGADCVVSSPPYAESDTSMSHGSGTSRTDPNNKNYRPYAVRNLEKHESKRDYGQTPGNLGNLKPGKVSAVIGSPPYTPDALGHGGKPTKMAKEKALHAALNNAQYGQTEGNLGNGNNDTFWQAAKQIVSECHKILKPQGIAIWVVKAFVRKGKLVDFPGDWQRLCEAQGFQTVCVHHAMLVKETTHNGLFEDITVKKERKSFFRRLAESKGSPAIDYETVLCMKKDCA
ncbi:MAG: hypothetical protein IMZ70_01365 [Candidatus Atribacteria bacterium]|nr:hypothetical protein [Candidatus Atribacteria bacterium]MBE3145012.1 hypothetical protein [Planctomycetota bacterium]